MTDNVIPFPERSADEAVPARPAILRKGPDCPHSSTLYDDRRRLVQCAQCEVERAEQTARAPVRARAKFNRRFTTPSVALRALRAAEANPDLTSTIRALSGTAAKGKISAGDLYRAGIYSTPVEPALPTYEGA